MVVPDDLAHQIYLRLLLSLLGCADMHVHGNQSKCGGNLLHREWLCMALLIQLCSKRQLINTALGDKVSKLDCDGLQITVGSMPLSEVHSAP